MTSTAIIPSARMPLAKSPQGGVDIAHQIVLGAGLPVTTSGMTVSRFSSSGLEAVAMAAQRIIVDHSDVLAAGVVESMSGVPNGADRHPGANPWRVGHKAEFCGSMLQAAKQVAKLDKIGRERMDPHAAVSRAVSP